jgi:DNA-binding transcriptional LysR family regulator
VSPDTPIRTPDLTELRAFEAAVRLRSIGAAAKELHLSQPAVSKRLRQLEAVVGFRLLERSPRGVTPTEAGEQWLYSVQRVLDELHDLERAALQLRGRPRPLRLAASAVAAESLLPSLLGAFHRQPGNEPVELIVCNSSLVRDLIASGRADVGIAASGPGEDQESPTLADDELLVAVPAGHPWLKLDTVPLDALTTTPLILREPGSNQRAVLDDHLSSLGRALAAPMLEVSSTAAALLAIAEIGAPAIVSRLSLPPGSDVAVRSVEDAVLSRRFIVLVSSRRPTTAVEQLIEALRATHD